MYNNDSVIDFVEEKFTLEENFILKLIDRDIDIVEFDHNKDAKERIKGIISVVFPTDKEKEDFIIKIKNNVTILLSDLDCNSILNNFFDGTIQDDEDFANKLLNISPLCLEFFSEKIKNNKDLICEKFKIIEDEAALAIFLSFADDSVKKDYTVGLEYLKNIKRIMELDNSEDEFIETVKEVFIHGGNGELDVGADVALSWQHYPEFFTSLNKIDKGFEALVQDGTIKLIEDDQETAISSANNKYI